MTPTESLLKELEELEAKATPGPWGLDYSNAVDGFGVCSSPLKIEVPQANQHNPELIVTMRTSLPALLQIIREQKSALEYGIEHQNKSHATETCTCIASINRQALSRCDEIAKGVGK